MTTLYKATLAMNDVTTVEDAVWNRNKAHGVPMVFNPPPMRSRDTDAPLVWMQAYLKANDLCCLSPQPAVILGWDTVEAETS